LSRCFRLTAGHWAGHLRLGVPAPPSSCSRGRSWRSARRVIAARDGRFGARPGRRGVARPAQRL